MSTETDPTRAQGSRSLTVLYADVSGSTRLYEVHGDQQARAAIGACVALLTEVTERFGGRVVKTIGDEVMCAFNDPARALMASTDMQAAVRAAGEAGRFVTGPLHIKVGLHHGPAIEEGREIAGEAPIVAQGIIHLAKADQVLTSDPTLAAAPESIRAGTRHFDRLSIEGYPGMLEVFEMVWEISDATRVADVSAPVARTAHERLILSYGGTELRLDADRPRAVIGRVEGNDLVVPTGLTSRTHAEIAYRNGRFHVTDNSANGTVVVREDGRTTSLRREHHMLDGRGRICLGGTPAENPDGLVEYACE